MLQHLGGFHKKVMNVVIDENVEDIKAEPVEADVDVNAFLDDVAVEEFFEEEIKIDLIDMDLD